MYEHMHVQVSQSRGTGLLGNIDYKYWHNEWKDPIVYFSKFNATIYISDQPLKQVFYKGKVTNEYGVVRGDEEIININEYTTAELGCRRQFTQKQIYYDVLRNLQSCWKGCRSRPEFEFPGISTSDGEAYA